MNYSARYPADMDWVRKRLILPDTASIYEVCVKMVEEIKSLDEQLKNSLLKEGKIYLTHPDMTRFWITYDRAAKFILENYQGGLLDEAMIPEMKASKVSDVAEAIAQVLGVSDYDTEIIGIRPGEKIHECLRSEHDSCFRSDTCEQYSMDELKTLVGPYL